MLYPRLVAARFVRRDNRFRVTVRVDGSETSAHLANSGRLTELLRAGAPVWLIPRRRPGRRTPFDLALVWGGDCLVSVDARIPNRLFAESLARGWPDGRQVNRVQPEIRLGKSRLDFVLGDRERWWIEVKSVTLVRGREALFPDAPTQRGTRHVQELCHLATQGSRAAIVFIVQRPDAVRFAPHRRADPILAQALRQAHEAGVEVRAYRCRVSLRGIRIDREIPVVGIRTIGPAGS